MSQPIDVDRTRQSVLRAIAKITEKDFLSDITFAPCVLASLSHAFTKYLIQDESVDPKARLECFDSAVDLYLRHCEGLGECEELFSEEDDEEFFEEADDDDLRLRNLCIGLLECCSQLEQSVGARPISGDWLINYGPIVQKKKAKTLGR